MELTVERLRELLDYDPLTGLFTWRVKRKGTLGIGSVAGCHDCHQYPSGSRYWKIGIDYRRHKRSRLAWLYVYDEWPNGELDHIDGNEGNDAIANLRQATRLQNSQNTRGRKHSRAKLKGVRWMSKPGLTKPWNARITDDKIERCLGYFATKCEAAEAYDAAAVRFHGAFARTNRMLGLL